mmetsp:Transcript_75738/g.202632  ORF Transcript_75738/g.202632 Transcript_75738/m.202632 type:complete len:221 (-) Transcript_75738:31-693(-)
MCPNKAVPRIGTHITVDTGLVAPTAGCAGGPVPTTAAHLKLTIPAMTNSATLQNAVNELNPDKDLAVHKGSTAAAILVRSAACSISVSLRVSSPETSATLLIVSAAMITYAVVARTSSAARASVDNLDQDLGNTEISSSYEEQLVASVALNKAMKDAWVMMVTQRNVTIPTATPAKDMAYGNATTPVPTMLTKRAAVPPATLRWPVGAPSPMSGEYCFMT